MPQYSFIETPTPGQIQDLLSLYRSAEWWTPSETEAKVAGIVAGSHCFLVATNKAPDGREVIIGMGRAISDGISDAYIQDVTVHAAHRGQGIAGSILTRLVTRLQAEGIGWIGLIAERNTQELYRRAGFSPMPDATPMLYRTP